MLTSPAPSLPMSPQENHNIFHDNKSQIYLLEPSELHWTLASMATPPNIKIQIRKFARFTLAPHRSRYRSESNANTPDTNSQRRGIAAAINRAAWRGVESCERYHRVAFVNHAVECILFCRLSRRQACKRSRATARAADKNTFVISLMAVPSIGFLSGAARRSLTYFGGVRLIALRPSYVS